MDPTFARRLLDVLVENSLRIMQANFGLSWAEAPFFEVVRLLREEELKGYFLEKVEGSFALREPGHLDPGMIPTELIELVAHEMRWPEFLDLAQRRIDLFFHGDKNLAIGDIAYRISRALDDAWEDRDFYRRYNLDEQGETGRGGNPGLQI